MLEIRNLTKTYRNAEKSAVKDLNLTVKSGEIYGFLGANGAGKSTTIKCICGILEPDSGDIVLDGVNLKTNPIKFKTVLGYVPDLNNAFERVTGKDYILHTANLYGKIENLNEKIDELAKNFNLQNAMQEQIKTYSHGMKQKLNMIAALIHDPKLWLLDEPMTGLDPKSTQELIAYMKEYVKSGNSIMFSSHILEMVEKICDKVCIVDEGKLLGEFEMSELKKKRQRLGKIYLQMQKKSV